MDNSKAFAAIVDLLGEYDSSSVRWTTAETDFGWRIEVKTTETALCPFLMELGKNELFGFYFGRGLGFETLSSAAFDPVLIVRAIVAGDVRERVWFLFEKLRVKVEGEIRLSDGQVLREQDLTFSFLAPLAKAKTFKYEPYPPLTE